MFFIGLFSIISLCGSVSIPIQRTLGNVPSVNVAIDMPLFATRVPYTFDLAISRNSRLYNTINTRPTPVHLPFGESIDIPMEDSRRQSSLGIGPGSPFLDRFGSAGIFRDELVFNMTMSDFVSRCEPGTNFTIPPLNRLENNYYVFASMWVQRPEGIPVLYTSALMYHENSPGMLVPAEVYAQVTNNLTLMGAIQDPENIYTFRNCSIDAVNSLSDLVIDFTSRGQIFVNPASFIVSDPATGICLVQFRSGALAPFTWAFSPFILPEVAVYVTNEGEMTFCDEAGL
jgi:hypothetical protein